MIDVTPTGRAALERVSKAAEAHLADESGGQQDVQVLSQWCLQDVLSRHTRVRSMDLFDLTGKQALVTGGTRGIGMMIARGLLDAGASVVISSRGVEACEKAVAELSSHGTVSAVPADLQTEEECIRLADAVDGLDILVNNAGATWGAPLEEFPASAWDKVLNLNLKSPFFLTRALLGKLEAEGLFEPQKALARPVLPRVIGRARAFERIQRLLQRAGGGLHLLRLRGRQVKSHQGGT